MYLVLESIIEMKSIFCKWKQGCKTDHYTLFNGLYCFNGCVSSTINNKVENDFYNLTYLHVNGFLMMLMPEVV